MGVSWGGCCARGQRLVLEREPGLEVSGAVGVTLTLEVPQLLWERLVCSSGSR